jgi:hypothetical protein
MNDETNDLVPEATQDPLSNAAEEPRKGGRMLRTVVRMSGEERDRFDRLRERLPGRTSRAALIRAFCVTGDPEPQEAHHSEEALLALANVMQDQARVARAEAAVTAARRRLNQSVARFNGIARSEEGSSDVRPLVADDLLFKGALDPLDPSDTEHEGTLRDRIVAAMEASPHRVFTSADLAAVLEGSNRDSIRNTLLVLAAKGRIEKRGEGRYRAREKPKPAGLPPG